MVESGISVPLRSAIEEVVQHELGRFGVERIEVVEREEWDGTPALWVLVHYRSADAEPDPKVAAGTITKLNDRLFALREQRFAHIAHRVPETERPARRRG